MLCILSYGQRSFVILIPKKELEKEKEFGAQIVRAGRKGRGLDGCLCDLSA